VQEERLQELVRLAAAAQTIHRDWPQVRTDEDMDGCDAVDWIGDLHRTVSKIQGLSTETVDADDVAEWVGLHYGKNYDTCTNAEKADWIQRYLESHEETTSDASNPVSVPKRTRVALDVWGETVTSDAWWLGNFWNSWVVPLFTEEDMTLLCERTEFFRDHLDGTFTVDPENEDLDMRETLIGEIFDIGGERVKLYAPCGLHFKLGDRPSETAETNA